jgi:hypothetical protein
MSEKDEFDKMNKPALIEACNAVGLEHEGQTANMLRDALRYYEQREVYDCDSCHYFESQVLLRDFIKASGNIVGDVCRQYKCWLPTKMKGCEEFVDKAEGYDPNRGRTSEARKSFHLDNIN